MDDSKIIELFWERSEEAISATAEKYGGLCFRIAGNILTSHEDCEECVSDTYLGVWNAIPDARPARFSAFIGKIARNLALKKAEYISAAKRSSNLQTSLEELQDCVSGGESAEDHLERERIESAINDFLADLTPEKRRVFIWRYWYFDSVEDICRRTGYSQSKVKSMLHSLRKKLGQHLMREGIEI